MQPISTLLPIITIPICGYLTLFLLLEKKPKPFFPIIAPSRILTLLPIILFLIMTLDPIEHLFPMITLLSIIVLWPMEHFFPIFTFIPKRTFFPKQVSLKIFKFLTLDK